MSKSKLNKIEGLTDIVDGEGVVEYQDLIAYLGIEAKRLDKIGDLVIGQNCIRKYCEDNYGIGKRQANRHLNGEDFILQRGGIYFTSTTSMDAHRETCEKRAAIGRRRAGNQTKNLIRMTMVSSGCL